MVFHSSSLVTSATRRGPCRPDASLLHQLVHLLPHQIQDPDLGPIPGQQLRLCRADAACTAGDNDDLILHVHVKSLPFMRYALVSLSFHALAGFCTPILPPLISSVVPVI